MASKGGRSRRNVDDLIAASAAAGRLNKDIASELDVGEQTVARRLRIPEVKQLVVELRSAMISRTVGMLSGIACKAVCTLESLLDAESDFVKLRAAQAILDALPRLREHEELHGRLLELEQRYANVDRPIGERFEAFEFGSNGRN